MTVRNLEFLFRPRSVAVIGATDRAGTVGQAVTHNVLTSGFAGPVYLVNRRHNTVAQRAAVADIAQLESAPDLAVVCTPAAEVPGVIAQLGARGTRAAIVLAAGMGRATDDSGRTLTQAMLDAARPYLLRILGPNCVGLLAPPLALNASFAHAPAQPGPLAFVAQSGALTTALLDWARGRGIGFSHFISLGDSADVDFGDVIDYLAVDPGTHSILLYIESITHARKFMSAARAAARNKPIIVVKAGRAPAGARAAASHTGALAGADDVYDAALRRAGVLRVLTTRELFLAAETLALAKPLGGERLAILTNGGGPGVLAADEVSLGGGTLATLSDATLARLNAVLPDTWSHANPIDIIGDASAQRYAAALQILLDDPQCDAVIFLHAPVAIVDSTEIARVCAPLLQNSSKPVFSCWLGAGAVAGAQKIFQDARLSTYDTPEEAIAAFLQVVQFRQNQTMLLQTPPASPDIGALDAATVRAVVATALAEKRPLLGGREAMRILAAYGIPVLETRAAETAEAAVAAADTLGYPVALKILSNEISHKSDVGGVVLDLESAKAVHRAADEMLVKIRRLRPHAHIGGFSVQHMAPSRASHELIIGVTTDAVFGPILLFGQGGTAVEVTQDKAVALPPLNVSLARDLIARTRVAKLLAGYRDRPAANLAAIESVLLRVAQLIADVPEIEELDINPLLADATGVVVLDARMRVAAARPGTARFAISPYPSEMEQSLKIGDETILLRPILPEDETQFKEFVAKITPADSYFRFFHSVRELPHSQLARFTQIDYDREMAFVAIRGHEILGEARAMADPDNRRAEYAILVRSDWTRKGLGYALMSKLIAHCRQRETGEIYGEVLGGNRRMLSLAATLGFKAEPVDDGVIRVVLQLTGGDSPTSESAH